MYTIEILGVDKIALLKAGTLNIQRRSDHRNSCSFTLITTAGGYLPKVGQDLKIMDTAVTIFGGIISTIKKRKIEVGEGADKLIEVNITSDGYQNIPQRRTPGELYYYNQTCGYIVADMITRMLGEEGIVTGVINAGATLTEYSTSVRSCKDILDEMATASGYKWYITDQKALYFIAEDTVNPAAHDIIEGGTFTDFTDVEVEESLDNYRNKQFVVGGLGDDGYQVSEYVEDATETAAQKAIEGGAGYSSGVYGNVLTDGNIDVAADATAAATNALKQYGIIPQTLKFKSWTLDWAAGTKLKANLPTFGITSDSYYLIEEVSLQDEDGKNLSCSVSATARKNADFSTQRSQTGIDYFSSLVKSAKNADIKVAGAGAEVLPDIDYYIDAVNGDDNNDGSEAHPFATIMKAMVSIPKRRIVNVNIFVEDGTYVGFATPYASLEVYANIYIEATGTAVITSNIAVHDMKGTFEMYGFEVESISVWYCINKITFDSVTFNGELSLRYYPTDVYICDCAFDGGDLFVHEGAIARLNKGCTFSNIALYPPIQAYTSGLVIKHAGIVYTSVTKNDTYNTGGRIIDLASSGYTRPTNVAPGTMFVDWSYGVAKPIWRDELGTGWIDATGAAV